MSSYTELSQQAHGFSCLSELLRFWAEKAPLALALEAPGGMPLSYGYLHDRVCKHATAFGEAGIGRGDRVAIVLPNGLEMAVIFLAVAGIATAAPLNPAYSQSEFEFYLSDLEAKGIVLGEGLETAARAAAEKLGIPVIDPYVKGEAGAGAFEFSGPFPASLLSSFGGPDDVALVLHTSGTTARPKLVPLSHRNLCVSADNVRVGLGLTEKDLCLNVMPLFHIHGLVAALLASLTAGARCVATPGFLATHFFDWLRQFRPTWYTAVPTMHQAILARLESYPPAEALPKLRFIRSSSAPLPPQVMQALERAFAAPVIEAYGMTEAAHQMASNPLPPGERKAGSVGIAAGPEIAVMDGEGNLLPKGCRGEVVIRGPNVTCGYVKNPEANDNAFTGGWFRTGDEGYLDEDGYLFLTGRLKEMINRGGEKISPREVEEVLLDHPAVVQAVAFALPDVALGEDVGAAVVLRDPEVSEAQLRKYAATRLITFKVPRHIIVVDEIPKGPTGKPQRIGLSAKLGIDGTSTQRSISEPSTAPRNEVEEALLHLWRDVLRIGPMGVYERFLDLGGDSVLAAQLVARIRQQLQIDVTLIDLLDRPTIAEQALLVEELLMKELEQLSDEDARRLADVSA
jgi:acyl-CoA synthetase (AMP-forming)/AMP-acid ligase II/aryl carrier-like protein